MRRRARVDGSHQAIVRALRQCGWMVWDTSRLGDGFPDLVIARAGVLRLVEVKDGSKPPSAQALTKAEWRCVEAFRVAGVSVAILRSEAEAGAL